MKYKAILFDMDGTLLPMNVDEFTKKYFELLCMKVAPLQVKPDLMIKALWNGVKQMTINDGSVNNQEAFWKNFNEITGVEREKVEPICNDFYYNEFKEVKCCIGDNELAKKAIELAHQKAQYVILATNPLFPIGAQDTRMSFVDLNRDDFDLVTAYEDSNFCKPNPKYYEMILDKFNLKPEECLMIGNDEEEDMYPCKLLGIDTYMVLGSEILSKDHPYNGIKGTFVELIDYLNNL